MREPGSPVPWWRGCRCVLCCLQRGAVSLLWGSFAGHVVVCSSLSWSRKDRCQTTGFGFELDLDPNGIGCAGHIPASAARELGGSWTELAARGWEQGADPHYSPHCGVFNAVFLSAH